jgi:hypothetical protein
MDRERGIEMRGSVAALNVSFFNVMTLHNPFSCLGTGGCRFLHRKRQGRRKGVGESEWNSSESHLLKYELISFSWDYCQLLKQAE